MARVDETSGTSMKQLTHLIANDFDASDEHNDTDYHVAASTGQHKSYITDLESKWKDIPDKYFIVMAHFLTGNINDTEAIENFNGPILKASIRSLYWIFIIQYAALAVLGIAMNVAIIVYIMYHRLYKDVTHAFIINLAFCHFVQCAVVLPISLMVMLIQNWIFGQFLCFFLPMLQDIPLHVAMITHILIAWDRMRWLGDPLKGRFPAFVCCCATWLTGMVIALPYPIYTIYVEIGDYVEQLRGIGLCVVNLMDDMHEYMRGLFLMMYCGPAVLLAYLYIRTSQELRPPDGPYAIMMYEHRADLRMKQRNSSASSVDRTMNASIGTTTTSGIGTGLTTITTHTSGNGSLTSGAATRSYDLYSAEMDVRREKRKQRNFGTMAASQVICVCPLMILRFARLSMEETYENQKHFDFTYLMFVWIAFLPTFIFPCVYASQILPRTEQERLRGYLRLSTKRQQKARNAHSNMAEHDYSISSRENSIEKDADTNTTQATAILTNGDGCPDNGVYAGNAAAAQCSDTKATARSMLHSSGNKQAHKQQMRHKLSHRELKTTTATKDNMKSSEQVAKKHDVKVKLLAEGGGGGKSVSAHNKQMKAMMSGSTSRHSSVNTLAGTQRKLTIESSDNNSCSNLTASTYCNGNSSLLDDGGTSNFGDVEDSSIVSGMLVSGNANSGVYFDKKWRGNKNGSFSDGSTYSRMDSSSTLARDYEIIDLLERERSMNIQEMLQREQQQQQQQPQPQPERRLLPDIEKIIQRSPKSKLDPYSFETNLLFGSERLTAQTPPSRKDSYSSRSSLNDNNLRSLTESSQLDADDGRELEEEVPQDFFDSYTPGGKSTLPELAPGSAMQGVAVPVAVTSGYQYQYSRRLSRKSSAAHYAQAGCSSHRSSKRDSFNSLNGTDLIAGAFGELDPTQPLSKMSVIDNRMRRSSGRNSSFSSSTRSSMKSRDYNHGSTHSAHPELDFRENIFAEL